VLVSTQLGISEVEHVGDDQDEEGDEDKAPDGRKNLNDSSKVRFNDNISTQTIPCEMTHDELD